MLALHCSGDSQLKIYSLSVKKNDDIYEVTNGNIITFSLHFFLDIFVFVSILSISKNIDTYRYLLTIFPSLILNIFAENNT